MSLINDALKRARQAQQKKTPPPSPGPALQPVEPARQQEPNLGILLPLALVALVGLVGLIVWTMTSGDGARSAGKPDAQVKSASTSPSQPAPIRNASTRTAPTTNSPSLATPKPAIAQPVAPPPASGPSIGAPVQTTAEPMAQPGPPVLAGAVLPTSAPSPEPTATTPAAPDTQPVAVASAPLPPPLPKLQGIFYRPERPAALLNGKMVLTGGMVGEFRVVAISQQNVTVARAGQTNVLVMPN